MGDDEEALEEVCGWLSSEVGLRMTVVDGARELMRKEEVYDVQDLADLEGLGELGRVFPARVTRLKVERALQRRSRQEGSKGAQREGSEPAEAEGETMEAGGPARLLEAEARSPVALRAEVGNDVGAEEATPEAPPPAPRKPLGTLGSPHTFTPRSPSPGPSPRCAAARSGGGALGAGQSGPQLMWSSSVPWGP